MDTGKLKDIINRKNERLEEHALGEASSIIDAIAEEQQHIKQSENRIAELRVKLKELSVQQVDAASVLGE